ncbi:hypothetical protein GJU41_11850 [Bacillus idriensis]|uniref:Uncharacterized protein n=1 Tax=Metabacillus idriensis TaxID=324768 RepID=A0A6I2MCB0_9BACI|nr:hypothetical protein [Metabacillus idriensis]MRX54666.1 hypothetical protein [Metabacillus idriensis]
MIAIIALICLAFLATVFIVMDTEGIEGAGVMKALLLILVAIPFGVILAGIIGQ